MGEDMGKVVQMIRDTRRGFSETGKLPLDEKFYALEALRPDGILEVNRVEAKCLTSGTYTAPPSDCA